MKKFVVFIFTCFLLAESAFAGNIYNNYGYKTGSFKTNGDTTTIYNRYGSRTETYKTNGDTTIKYDKYGSKQEVIKKTSSGYNTYDKYGSKTGSFKIDSNGRTTSYDKYGQKTGSYRTMVIPLLIMTNMVVKLVVIGKTYYSLKLSEC